MTSFLFRKVGVMAFCFSLFFFYGKGGKASRHKVKKQILNIYQPKVSGVSIDPELARLQHYRSAMPGVLQRKVAFTQSLMKAYRSKGKKYKARTHHFLSDGLPQFLNRLIFETSPYLLQHAHNPVNWYPWGKEAFAKAKRENKPILLSVGYSTCHWCHVMERESFENTKTAEFMNKNYIAIKVDREERTDVDGIYMSAVQLFVGSGGWPMTVWLTPDKKPFYGGTYFPPKARWGRKSFLQMLQFHLQRFRSQPTQVAKKANWAVQRIRSWSRVAPIKGLPSNTSLYRTARIFSKNFDSSHGGRKGRPKFPSSWSSVFMMRYYHRSGEKGARKKALTTLRKMAKGGIYDHVAGGFHRYATDRKWLVPHFEKMLYDNALLVPAYLDAFQLTKDPFYRRIVKEVLDYVIREMTSSLGGFYSATDADSEGEEGKFFVWKPTEIDKILGKKASVMFKDFYQVTSGGNFEGKNILHTTNQSDTTLAKKYGLTKTEFWKRINAARWKLYHVRKKRIPPLCDTKVITSWNALMITAFVKAGMVLGEQKYIQHGVKAATYLLRYARNKKGRLYRTTKLGKPKHNAYLEDYSFLIAALLDTFEATHEKRWFEEARKLQKILDRYYWDTRAGGYFRTSFDHEKLFVRPKPRYDGAVPTGNSIAAMNLLRFQEFLANYQFRKQAEKLFQAFGRRLRRWPVALSEMMLAVDFFYDSPKEIVLIKPKKDSDISGFMKVLRETYLPNRILIVGVQSKTNQELARTFPVAKKKYPIRGKVTAYVCKQMACELPTTSPKVFAKQLKKLNRLYFPKLP